MRLVDRSLPSYRSLAGWMVLFVLSGTAPTVRGQEGSDGASEKPAERSLFDGQSLGDWKPTRFGGEGKVEVSDGQLVLHPGSPLTGVTWSGEAPSGEYELTLEAKKTRGIDFFCGLTFPVGDEHCSLIVGGWAGSLVGLSCLDGNDAAHNDTKRYLTFEKDRWYRIKVRVTDQAILAWIDDEQVIDQPRANIEFSVRGEVLLSRPLGLCTFETEGVYRNLAWRPIDGDSEESTNSDRR